MPVGAERREDRIWLASSIREKDRVKEVPGARYDRDERAWHLPLAWSTCLALRGVFGDELQIGEQLWAWAEHERATRVEPCLELRGHSDYDLRDPCGSGAPDPAAADLRRYQRVGVRFLELAEQALLGDEMGTGKTVQLAVVLRRLAEASGLGEPAASDAFPALVVCPNSVKYQWERELGRWCPAARVAVTGRTASRRREAIERIATGAADVLVINWDVLRKHSRLAPYGSIRLRRCEVCDPEGSPGKRQTSCHRCEKELNEIEWATVVADEAHRGKDPSTQWTRALWSIAHADSVRYRYALTGTPIEDAVDDAWAIMHFLAPHEYAQKTAFIDRYALQSWNVFGGMDVVGIHPTTREEFFGFFDARFLRRPKAAVLPDLPPKTYVLRECEATAKQRRIYGELADEMLARLDSGDLVLATNPLSRATRLHQAAAANLETETCPRCDGTGVNANAHEAQPHPDPRYAEAWCYCATPLDDPVHSVTCSRCRGEGKVYALVEPSCKLDELDDLLDEVGRDEQVVVFAVSRQLLELAGARLDKRDVEYASILGTTPTNVRDLHVQQFVRGERRVALVTIDAGGEGLDGLQVASTAVFLQRHPSLLKNKQAEDRVHRIGQESDRVVIVDVRTRDTIEADREVALAEKDDRFQELMRDEATVRRLLQLRPT